MPCRCLRSTHRLSYSEPSTRRDSSQSGSAPKPRLSAPEMNQFFLHAGGGAAGGTSGSLRSSAEGEVLVRRDSIEEHISGTLGPVAYESARLFGGPEAHEAARSQPGSARLMQERYQEASVASDPVVPSLCPAANFA